MHRAKLTFVLLAGFVFVALGRPSTLVADPIEPGFDLLRTPPGAAAIDVPGVGLIELQGDPIGPGNTDTIVQRKTGLADGALGTIEIELVALSLRSVDPVDVGGELFDVHVTLDPGTPSPGVVNVLDHGSEGGQFDSFFDVFFEIDLTPLNPSGTPLQSFGNSPLSSTPTPWSHTPPPDYPTPLPGGFFGASPFGGFFVTPAGIVYAGGGILGYSVPSQTIVPEPGGIVLMGSLAAALALGGWRRRRSGQRA